MATPEFEIRPALIKGDLSDAYLHWTKEILRLESMNPKVLMDFVAGKDGILCGVEEAKSLLTNVLPKQEASANIESDVQVWALADGDEISAGEPVLRVIARYASFGLYETSITGMLSSASAWATAARECCEAAEGTTVIGYGARYTHPNVAQVIDYASVVGGCSSVSTILGSKHANRNPLGNMPHNLPLIFGDTVVAAQAFDKHMGLEMQRIVLVDTFRDEVEEALNVAQALRERLRGIRLGTPKERGGVTPMMVREIRDKLEKLNFGHVEIFVSGGLNPDQIRNFRKAGSPIGGYMVGSYISSADPNNFTADIREIEGRPVARKGRMPGRLDGPRLDRVI